MYSPVDFDKMAEMLLEDLSETSSPDAHKAIVKMFLQQAHSVGINDSWWMAQDRDESWITSHMDGEAVREQINQDYDTYSKWKAL